MKKGILITFEGTEGGGKSTQIKRAAAYLESRGFSVLVLREPGGTRVSEAIRQVLLNKDYREMNSGAELLLYLAARAQIVNEKILPALRDGKIVICDRFEDSTLAYQGYGRGISTKAILKTSAEIVRGKLQPHLTFLFDIDPRKGLRRGGRHDRMERQSMTFHHKVRAGFLEIAKQNFKRCRVLDATQSIEVIAAKIQEHLDACLRIK